MHNVPTNAPIRTYILDLVYLSAALQGAGFDDLAARAQTAIAALKHQRAEYERAEELEVVATAAVSARDYQLDTSVTAAAALLKAHHPALFTTVFPATPSAVVKQAYDDEMRSVRAAVAHLATLPGTDPVRTAFASRLDAHVHALEQSLAQKDDVLTQFAVVRSAVDRAKSDANALRLALYAELLTRTGDKKVTGSFFRPAPPASAPAPAAPPADPAPTH